MRRTVQAAALGQLLAAIIAVTAVASTSLANQGLSAPTLQSSLNYALLGCIYTALHVRAHGWRLKCAWWAYALLALLDVEGNFCLVMAYRYTTLTSVTLLDCFTIPMVVLLSTALLGAAYRRGHYAGAGICIVGLLLLVLTDRGSGGSSSNPMLGDGLVLLGACLYATCNVLQEWLLGDVPVHELLGTMGLFGCLWSALQGLPLELHTLTSASWTPSALLPFFGFGIAMFSFYSLVPYELKWGGSALLNISLLSSDLWTAVARYFFFGGFQGNSLAFFLLSLIIVSCGILLFTLSGDVDTQLGAGSPAAAAAVSGTSSGLPVVYHRVPGSGAGGDYRRPLSSLSSKDAQGALQEVQREQQQQQQAQPAALPNPFDITAGLRLGGSSAGGGAAAAGGFLPLATAEEEPWPAGHSGGGAAGSLGGTPRTPPVAAAAAAQSAGAGAGAGGMASVGIESAAASPASPGFHMPRRGSTEQQNLAPPDFTLQH